MRLSTDGESRTDCLLLANYMVLQRCCVRGRRNRLFNRAVGCLSDGISNDWKGTGRLDGQLSGRARDGDKSLKVKSSTLSPPFLAHRSRSTVSESVETPSVMSVSPRCNNTDKSWKLRVRTTYDLTASLAYLAEVADHANPESGVVSGGVPDDKADRFFSPVCP
ncbi:uncharacterized protein BKA78DRAFT_320411 [Phyllosticta capitalensis]|uniref:uncharacterized protein n=1 Tax=Phyllosticta capitalensis TaxID=121624 RepID=UPI003131E03C